MPHLKLPGVVGAAAGFAVIWFGATWLADLVAILLLLLARSCCSRSCRRGGAAALQFGKIGQWKRACKQVQSLAEPQNRKPRGQERLEPQACRLRWVNAQVLTHIALNWLIRIEFDGSWMANAKCWKGAWWKYP